MNKIKSVVSFFFVLVLSAPYLEAQEIVNPPVKHEIPFSVGEKLTYQVKYGFIVAGTTTLTVTEELYKRKKVFHAQAIGQTTGIANTLYGVKDIYESWFDIGTNLPYKQVRDIKEGHYTKYNEVTYDRKNNTVNSKLSGLHDVPEKILDLASTFYYLRRVDFTKLNTGDVIFVNMYFADEIFPFHLRYLGLETIRTRSGKISCYKISPVVEVGRMFKSQDDLTIWFTNDQYCLPVLVRMELRIVGAVILKLSKYENVGDSLMIQN